MRWGSWHHRVSGQIGGVRSFQVGSSHRGCPHAKGVLPALNNHAEVDVKRRCLEGKSALPSMVGNQVP